MRHNLKGIVGLAGVLASAVPTAVQAAPNPAPNAATVRDMACFVMMGKLAAAPPDKLRTSIPQEALKVSTGYFGGKVAVRYPGQNLLTVINTNRDVVNAALAKPDPGACLREMQVMTDPNATAPKR